MFNVGDRVYVSNHVDGVFGGTVTEVFTDAPEVHYDIELDNGNGGWIGRPQFMFETEVLAKVDRFLDTAEAETEQEQFDRYLNEWFA